MRELEYPFDANYILSKKKSIRRKLLADTSGMIEKNVAVLGGYTTNDISLIMELFLLNYGIKPRIYESEYNQFYQDAMFDNPELEAFHPDIIYVCTCNRNIIEFPYIQDSKERVDELLHNEINRYTAIWTSLAERYQCPIIQNNFEMPLYRLMGNKDASDIHGRVNFLTRLNIEFYEYAQAHEDFYICDINYIVSAFGCQKVLKSIDFTDIFGYLWYTGSAKKNVVF